MGVVEIICRSNLITVVSVTDNTLTAEPSAITIGQAFTLKWTARSQTPNSYIAMIRSNTSEYKLLSRWPLNGRPKGELKVETYSLLPGVYYFSLLSRDFTNVFGSYSLSYEASKDREGVNWMSSSRLACLRRLTIPHNSPTLEASFNSLYSPLLLASPSYILAGDSVTVKWRIPLTYYPNVCGDDLISVLLTASSLGSVSEIFLVGKSLPKKWRTGDSGKIEDMPEGGKVYTGKLTLQPDVEMKDGEVRSLRFRYMTSTNREIARSGEVNVSVFNPNSTSWDSSISVTPKVATGISTLIIEWRVPAALVSDEDLIAVFRKEKGEWASKISLPIRAQEESRGIGKLSIILSQTSLEEFEPGEYVARYLSLGRRVVTSDIFFLK